MPKILVVEDDEDLRSAIVTSLQAANFEALEAPDGEAGVKLALEEHPDLILLDIMMPKLNGHETLEIIRKDNWGAKVKVIFLTALSDAENIVYAVEKGSEDYIIKSHTSLKEIVKKVRLALI